MQIDSGVTTVNKKQLQEFDKCLKYWHKQLNLLDYDLQPAESGEMDDEHQFVLAETIVNLENRWALIKVNEEWEPTGGAQLNRTALHEMLEVMLYDIRTDLLKRYCWETVDRKIHAVIRTLENILLPERG